MISVTTRTIWTVLIAAVLLGDVISEVAAQVPPQEESVGDGISDNIDTENGDDPREPPPADKEDSPCSLCLDGSNPVASDIPFESIFGIPSSLTCNDVIATSATEEESEDCDNLQLAAFQGGCCAETSFFNTPSTFERCQLCPEGEGPEFLPFKEIPGSTTAVDAATEAAAPATCSDLRRNTDVIIDFLQGFLQSPGDCEDSVLRRSAGWCGCMGTSIECSLQCDGGAAVNTSIAHPLTGMTCQEIDYQVALLDATECLDKSLHLRFDPIQLCCPSSGDTTTSTPSCSLCTNQQELTPSMTIATEDYGSITCSDAQAAADLVVSDQVCTDFRRQFSTECCLETPTDESIATCALTCPSTGERPPDWQLEDPETGYSCNVLVAEYAKFTASQCLNATNILGFDAVSFCCPETQDVGEDQASEGELVENDPAPAPLPSENEPASSTAPYECRVCPNDKQLLYPSRVLFAYNQNTCHDIEAAASSITAETACWDLLDSSRALSNCLCRDVQTGEEEENGSGEGETGSGEENGDENGSSSGGSIFRGVKGVAMLLLLLLKIL